MAGTFSLSDLMDQVGSFQSQALGAGKQLYDLSLDEAVSHSADATLNKQIGENSQIIDQAKLNADFLTQQNRLTRARALGTDIGAQGELMTGLSSSILDLMDQQKKASGVIAQKQSVGLFDNPLQYVMNQLTIGDDVAKHAGITQQLGEAEANMSELNRQTQSGIITENALNAPLTEAGKVASSQNIANLAAIKANADSRAALASNAQGITAALKVSNEIQASTFNAVQAKNAADQIGIAQAHLDLQRQEFDFRRDEKKLADAARDKGKQVDQYLLDNVNAGLRATGNPEVAADSVRAGTILSLIKSNSPAGKIYSDAMQIGMRNEQVGGGANIIGTSPSNSLEIMSQMPVKLNPSQGAVKDLLETAAGTFSQAVKVPGSPESAINPKDHQAVGAAVNQTATAILSTMAKKIIPGDSSNVFQIAPLGSIISASPEAQKLAVVEKVIAPIIATGGDMNDPNKVFGVVASALQKGTITYPEAIELTSLYQRGVSVNLASRNLQGFGLNLTQKNPGAPSIFSYNASIESARPGGGEFRGKTIVDMTKPDLLGRALNRYMASVAEVTFRANNVTPDARGNVEIYNQDPEYWKNLRNVQENK